MRVVHVTPTPFGSSGLLGGGERYPLELARALANLVDCELVTFGRTGGVYRESSGLLVRVLPYRLLLRGHPAHPVAAALIRAADGDVVHTHQLRSAPSRLAALAAAARRTPLVNTDHGLAGGDWFGLLPAMFDRFLTVSESSARMLGVPAAKVKVIYGGADPVRFSPADDGDRRGVLFVGRLTPHKGVDRLIAALPPRARLTIAGSGGHDPRLPERGYPSLLRRLAVGRDVQFAGPVDDADLPGLYRRAAVFVLPSVERTCYGRSVEVSELLGLSAIEAMASGTPVIASRTGGLPEVVRDGETGFLVAPGDVEGLGERIGQLLRDPRTARQMGERAREVVLRTFTWAACAQRCLGAYQEIT